MSLSKMEAQRLMERVAKLESQVGSLTFKLQNMEKAFRPEEILRRVREGEADEKRKGEQKDMLAAQQLLGPKPPNS
jgi:hypothetical protein